MQHEAALRNATPGVPTWTTTQHDHFHDISDKPEIPCGRGSKADSNAFISTTEYRSRYARREQVPHAVNSMRALESTLQRTTVGALDSHTHSIVL
jgi:hypothetical protein